MKPESVKLFAHYRLSDSVAKLLKVAPQSVKVRGRYSYQSFLVELSDGSLETVAADDFNPIPSSCSVLDAGPL